MRTRGCPAHRPGLRPLFRRFANRRAVRNTVPSAFPPADGTACRRFLHEDDGAFSTLGMAVALLVTISLVFSTAQVYRVMSAAADIQDVADAAALAAENEVAEFMVAVRVCDAVCLSLSLTGICATGLGVAALCTPVTAGASETLLAAGRSIFEARTRFAYNATKGLNSLQKALPFLAAANASAVCSANNVGETDSHYVGIALLVDSKGEDIEVPDLERSDELLDEVESNEDEIRAAAQRAEEAAQQANEAKRAAFLADCGDNPAYCMYERADALAGLSGASNPLYHSADTWSFSAALERARAYYAARAAQEWDAWYSTAKENAGSALRARFYAYACEKLGEGYVYESEDAFDAYFPLMPRNNAELRETELYTERIYPVTVANAAGSNGEGGGSEGGGESESACTYTMHAYGDCPGASEVQWYGSIADLEEGDFEVCPYCGFTVQSMGHIAAATTSTATGFEHYYVEVAEQAALYEEGKSEMEPQSRNVKEKAGSLFETCVDLCREALSCRIEAQPPGSYGAIALVVDTQESAASAGFESLFVQSDATLGARAAVSGATLIEDDSSEGGGVLSSLLDGIAEEAGVAGGFAGVVLDLWTGLLQAYSSGQDAITSAVEGAVNLIPFASASGLGTWASQKFQDAMEGLGLQPANLNALKPVTVNSGSVAEGGSDVFAVQFLSVKNTALKLGGGEELLVSAVTDVQARALEALRISEGTIELVTIEPLGSGGPSVPLTITLPSSVTDAAEGFASQVVDAARSLYALATGRRIWR